MPLSRCSWPASWKVDVNSVSFGQPTRRPNSNQPGLHETQSGSPQPVDQGRGGRGDRRGLTCHPPGVVERIAPRLGVRGAVLVAASHHESNSIVRSMGGATAHQTIAVSSGGVRP